MFADYTFDHRLFLWLNFDGGPTLDRIMTVVSGTAMWLPLYGLICWLVMRRSGWRGLVLFVVLLAAALVLTDIVAGIFKHTGPLKGLWPSFPPRWRPMFTPALEGLSITPDSLYAVRRAGVPGDWAVHVPVWAVAGRYGTVSSHAATVVALAVLGCGAVRRRWLTAVMVCATLLIGYSRIYLAKHFPMDLVWGALVGALLGWGALWLFRRFARQG